MATLAQQRTLALTPKCTSFISMCSSSFIIYEVICDARRSRSSAIQRILVGMSAIDICASFGWFLSTWAVPTESDFAFSQGNTATCNFQGFLLQLAVGAPLYNSSLALFYLMVIKYNWTNSQLRSIETLVHGAILTFAIGTSILLLPLQQYNHIGAVCWVIGAPSGCGHSTNTFNPDVPCERGDYAYLYGLALFYGPLWVCVIMCIVCMMFIFYEVRATHRRLDRYGRRNQLLRRSATDTSAVAAQAFYYCLSFFFCWAPSTIWSIAYWFGVEQFWLDVLAACCEPLQGFINMLIFVRRRPASQDKIQRALATITCISWLHPDKRSDSQLSWSGHHARSSEPMSSRFQVSFYSHQDETPKDTSSQDDLSRECAIVEVDDESGSASEREFEERIISAQDEDEADQTETETSLGILTLKQHEQQQQQQPQEQQQQQQPHSNESITIYFSNSNNAGQTEDCPDDEEGEAPIIDVDQVGSVLASGTAAIAAVPMTEAASAEEEEEEETHRERIRRDESYIQEEKRSTNSTRLGESLHVYFSSSTNLPDDLMDQVSPPPPESIEPPIVATLSKSSSSDGLAETTTATSDLIKSQEKMNPSVLDPENNSLINILS